MRITRQVITMLALGVPATAFAQEAEVAEHPQTIIERPPILPLGSWRASIEMSAVGLSEERTGAVGLSTGMFPGTEVGARLITEFGNRERETGAKVRAHLVRSLVTGPRLAVVTSLHGEYDYDARKWMDVGFGAQAQLRLAAVLLFAGGDKMSGDIDQASARMTLPVGIGLQLTPRVYADAVVLLDASYDSDRGASSSATALAASAYVSLTEAMDVVITANASDEYGTDPEEILWLLAARYQGAL